MDIPFIIGISAGVFTCVSMFPQVIKVIKEKKAENISLWMPLVLFVGHALWITYGFLKQDLPLIIPNCISIILDTLLVFFTLKYGTGSNAASAQPVED